MIDDEATTKQIMEEYWTPMWKHSYTGEDVDVDEVMDSLDIDRDGGDPNNIDEETMALMHQAEMANAGVGNSELYEEEVEA